MCHCVYLSLAVEQSESVFSQKADAKCLIGITGKIDLNKSHKLTEIRILDVTVVKFQLQRLETSFVGSLGGKNRSSV